MDSSNKKKDVTGAEACGVFILVLCAVFYKKGAEIEFWLYEHLMRVTGIVMGIFAICALIMLFRLKKKEGEHFERARAVRSVKASGKMTDYYKGGE